MTTGAQRTAALLQEAVQLHQQNRVADAAALYRRVLAQDRTALTALNNLAVICFEARDFSEAERLLQQSIAIDPGRANAHNTLGNVYQAQRRWSEAEACYRRALALEPRHTAARNNLAFAYTAQQRFEEAIASYTEALAFETNAAARAGLLVSLGNCYRNLGQLSEVAQAYQEAIQLDPGRADAHAALADVKLTAFQLDEAAQLYRAALVRHPTPAEAAWSYNGLGRALAAANELPAALEAFGQALALDPQHGEAKLGLYLSLPVIYQTTAEVETWRTRYAAGLERLQGEVAASPGNASVPLLQAVTQRTPFYLASQGRNDRDLQRDYGQLLDAALRRFVPPYVPPARPQRARLRIGYVSPHFRDHSVGKTTIGFVRDHDPRRFEIYTYYLGGPVQPRTEEFRRHSDVFRHLLPGPERLITQLRDDQLDIAVFADVGMEPITGTVAAARVAPVQCAHWGHPVTTGLATMDYYISSALMEPPDAAAHYTEQLIALQGIGVSYPRPPSPPVKTRADFGLPEEALVLLSTQTAHKYLPSHDHLFPEIAQRVGNARFVFLTHPSVPRYTQLLQERIKHAFVQYGLRWEEYCHVLPALPYAEFLALNQLADIFLDTPSWSGCNSALEALAAALPVVTLPGQTMRSRHAYAMLHQLDLTECIAQDEADYVRLTVELARNADWRQDVKRRIAERADGALFNQRGCVAELESWFERASGDQRACR